MKTLTDIYRDMIRELIANPPYEIEGTVAVPRELERDAQWLRGFAVRIDVVILALGKDRSASIQGGISERDIKEDFTNVLLGAVDGCATFILEDHAASLREQNFEDSMIGCQALPEWSSI